jgi:hypothetical protein
MSSQHFLDNADNCAAMAERAKTEADRNRYLRMERHGGSLRKPMIGVAPVEVEGNHGLAA